MQVNNSYMYFWDYKFSSYFRSLNSSLKVPAGLIIQNLCYTYLLKKILVYIYKYMYHDLNNKMLKSSVIHARYESGSDFAEKIRVSVLCNFFCNGRHLHKPA